MNNVPPPVSSTDASLLQLALTGSDSALAELVEFYRPFLMRVVDAELDSALRPRIGASDIVQSAVLAASVGFEEFRGQTQREFRRWLLSILNNTLVDAVRRERAKKRDPAREAALSVDRMPAVERSPSHYAIVQDDVNRLLAGIAQLNEESRHVVRLRYVEGLSFEEIGRRLQLSGDAVRRRWLRAVQDLTARLRSEESPDVEDA